MLDAAGHLFVGGSYRQVPPPQGGPASSTFGSTTLANAGGRDAVIAQLDKAGTWQWAVRAGGPGDDALGPLGLDA